MNQHEMMSQHFKISQDGTMSQNSRRSQTEKTSDTDTKSSKTPVSGARVASALDGMTGLTARLSKGSYALLEPAVGAGGAHEDELHRGIALHRRLKEDRLVVPAIGAVHANRVRQRRILHHVGAGIKGLLVGA